MGNIKIVFKCIHNVKLIFYRSVVKIIYKPLDNNNMANVIPLKMYTIQTTNKNNKKC